MFSPPETNPPTGSWRARALDRSLADARARSVERLERFVGAARELADESASAAFTVQQVVARAGLSLKSFYACFHGKDELLLALLEEDSRIGAALLDDAVGRHRAPARRLEEFVRAIFALAALPEAHGYVSVLVREYLRLTETHPAELRRALAPILEVLRREIATAAGTGAAHADDPERDAAMVFALVMTQIAALVLDPGTHDAAGLAEQTWRFCWSGLRAASDGSGGELWG